MIIKVSLVEFPCFKFYQKNNTKGIIINKIEKKNASFMLEHSKQETDA